MTTQIRNWARTVVARALRRMYRAAAYYEETQLPVFASRPRNLRIRLPRRISGAEHIQIGDDVDLGPGCLLTAIDHYPPTPLQDRARPRAVQVFKPRIVIGNRVTATSNLTIGAHQEVVIEDDVLFASNINITDGLHGFTDATEPYKYQPIFRIAPIRIGRGCWIGQNVVVMPGVVIGEQTIVGANSVVTGNLPPRSIAVGAPARVIKQWDDGESRWVPIAELEQRGARGRATN